MKLKSKWFVALLLIITSFVIAANLKKPQPKYTAVTSTTTNEDNFNKMMDVLTHKRCMNCHPNDNIPKQGEDSHPHYFGMSRGTNNLGFEATKCTTCHQTENNKYSGVPGAPEWSLAPPEMFWEGLDRYQIAASMMDTKRNGGRTPNETMHHLIEHELVLWAWNPGVNSEGIQRELPPVSLEEYKKTVKQWFKDGAIIPNKPTK
ncbi:hypothetical protein RRF68_07315 [Tenacibaculum sp. HL-MS23]|uniref:hypothetical protein n=1 Tax=Tenacibaculum sp. HL-MS23 TaxID=3077734 RepID=UPI0028FC198E|nr:hypothetical protein [Tenacibaculum sp. HL-MS23]WNW00805.1 hypothetical protein RRF68_07315 [Tenacibaculum sp. HL-MS23]